MNRLLESKWKKFAGPMFLFNFLAYMMYLCIFTVLAYNKKSRKVSWMHLTARFCAAAPWTLLMMLFSSSLIRRHCFNLT